MERLQERQSGSGGSAGAGRAVENTYSFVWCEQDMEKWYLTKEMYLLNNYRYLEITAELKNKYTAPIVSYFWDTTLNQSSWCWISVQSLLVQIWGGQRE